MEYCKDSYPQKHPVKYGTAAYEWYGTKACDWEKFLCLIWVGGCLRGVVGRGGSTVLALYTGNPSLELECLLVSFCVIFKMIVIIKDLYGN